MAISSTSAKERAALGYFVDFHAIKKVPRSKQKPDVEQ